MSTPHPIRDSIVLVDGPLEGRRFLTEPGVTPDAPLDVHAAVAMDGTVLAMEDEPAPVNVPFRGVEYRYAPVYAPDGHQSRGDDGYLRFCAVSA